MLLLHDIKRDMAVNQEASKRGTKLAAVATEKWKIAQLIETLRKSLKQPIRSGRTTLGEIRMSSENVRLRAQRDYDLQRSSPLLLRTSQLQEFFQIPGDHPTRLDVRHALVDCFF